MKKLILIAVTLLSTSVHAADDPYVYGWDILCKGTSGFMVHAFQSDDDFFAIYKSKTIKEVKVWMDSMSQDNLDMLNLLFITSPEYSNKITAALSVTRKNTSNNQFTTGVMMLEGERHELNCFTRYGKYEDDFAKIIKVPFPKLKTPIENKF